MSQKDSVIIGKIASATVEDLFVNHVSQVASKSLLKEITDQIPEYSWTYVEEYLTRNALTLSSMIENATIESPETVEKLKNSTVRLAALWECISRLNEETPKNMALINAAVLYELAGYQANASCLSKAYCKNTADTNVLGYESGLMLQRLFFKLKQVCAEQIKEPKEQTDDLSLKKKLGIAIASIGFTKFIDYFLDGNESHMNEAIKNIDESEKLFSMLGFIEESNLLHSIRSLLPIMKSKSTWEILKKYSNADFTWKRYLTLLARGLGNDIVNNSSVSELWPSQVEALEKGLLTTNESKVIRMPTSAGKTRIAEMGIINALTTKPGSKCIYIAPYRALVSELEDTFLSVFSDLGFRVSSIVGHYENDPFEKHIINDADVLVTTPEKLDLLLRSHSEFLEKTSLFIIDEGHIVNSEDRGIKLEILLSRLRRKYADSRFLVLSAVLSDETIEDFLAWFDVSNEGLISSDWRPTIQQYAKFEWTKVNDTGKLAYVPTKENQLMKLYVPRIIEHKKYTFTNPKTGYKKSITFPSKEKNETAAELGFKFSSLGPVLISTTEPRLVLSIAKKLAMRLEYTKNIGEEIPSYFQNNESKSIKIAEEWLGKDHEITTLLKNGIATHYGKLPENLKRAIEKDFRNKKFKIIVATNTLSQGVNFPIRTVIIHSCRRYAGKFRKRISVNEYWNLAGRAGRAGQETNGTVIHIIGNTIDDERDYHYYLQNQTKLEPTNGALFDMLNDLVSDRINDEFLKMKIDPEVLAILAEENSFESYEESIENLLSRTLVNKQAKRHKIDDTKLNQAFTHIASKILEETKDHDVIKIYGTTGLTSSSCKAIHNYILERKDKILSLIDEENYEKLIPFISLNLDILYEISEMTPTGNYDGDRLELLKLWISGKNFSELLEEIDDKDILSVLKFIEDYFGYKTPWGISAFLQIMCKVLNISEKELPMQIRFLPSMIKHGVPLPEASWAMQVGIPFKEVAVKLATKYKSENDTPEFSKFVSWLSNIDAETMHNEYGLEVALLEDVTKSISRTENNPYLRDKQDLENVIKQPTWLQGIKFENRKIAAALVKKGEKIEIFRDYQNLYDRNAIKVSHKGKELGFLNRNLAQYLAPLIDSGTKLNGEIIDMIKEEIPQIKIQILS